MPKNIEEYNGSLTDELIYLALLSGHYSRFKKDTLLAIHFERLYKTWIHKSISKVISDKVLVYKLNKRILGFITLKEVDEYIRIGLIAVHDKYWGKGIGSSLLQAVSYVYPNKKNIVSTQKQNKGAIALYERNGFSLDKSQYVYHLWK